MPKDKIYREIEAALKKTGFPYEIVEGKNHRHVRLGGKLIGVFCRSAGDRRDCRQILTKIENRKRELQAP